MTVEQLLARQGGSVARRRAARRADEPSPGSRYESPGVRSARPPAAQPARTAEPARHGASAQPGLPPVPPSGRPGPAAAAQPGTVQPGTAQPGLPPVPDNGRHPSLPLTPMPTKAPEAPDKAPDKGPESRPQRHSTPIPPLPGLAPRPTDASPRKRLPHRRPDRPPMSPGRRRLTRAVLAIVAVVGLIALYHLGLYFYVDQKVGRVDALATDGPEVLAPALQAGTETYLIVGTHVPGESGPGSVSVLLASVNAKGDRAALVSVPPTAFVDTPECRRDNGSLREPASEAVASSLLDGGPSCLVRAVQQLSGLRVDHYLGVDFGRLPGMVDALGGVSVCVLPTPAAAAAATPLPAGRSEVTGKAASGYLQPRDATSDVTGAGVSERGQLLLTSTLRAAMAPRTLANSLTLTRFLSRAADALTVDQQTTLGDLRVLASTLGSLQGDAVQRAGLPVAEQAYTPAGSKQSFVLLDSAATRQLFDTVIDRTRVPAAIVAAQAEAGQAGQPPPADGEPAAAPGSPAAAPATQPLTVTPDKITLDVLNGTGTTGLAGTVADALKSEGFTVGTVGNESAAIQTSVVRFGPNAAEQARTVAAAVPGAVLQPTDGIGDAVQLVIGPGYQSVVPVQVPPSAPPSAAAPVDTTTPAPTPAPTPAATPAPASVSC